jgi:hypothetical protein
MTFMCPTLEQLEGVDWGEPECSSYLVTTVHRLRRKPVELFTVEDLRIMIGQSIGLEHLVPLALDILEKDCLAQGDFYPGDLACNVVRMDPSFLEARPELVPRIVAIARAALPHLEREDAALGGLLRTFLERWDKPLPDRPKS